MDLTGKEVKKPAVVHLVSTWLGKSKTDFVLPPLAFSFLAQSRVVLPGDEVCCSAPCSYDGF